MDDCQLYLRYVLFPDMRGKVDRCNTVWRHPASAGSRSVCVVCDEVTSWEIQDQGEDHLHLYKFDGPPKRLVWERAWVHPWCASSSGEIWAPKHKELDTHDAIKKALHRRERSGRILLLLLEAGLPRDVAWPITAVACWLLV